MDPFTERILEGARERQRKILEYSGTDSVAANINSSKSSSAPEISREFKTEVLSESVSETYLRNNKSSGLKETLSEGNLTKSTRISSNMPGSPQPHLKTFHIQKDNFNMEIKLSSTDDVRVEVEFQDDADNKENMHSESVLRDDAKKRLQRLGKLYAGGDDADISSPIHRTEATFSISEDRNIDENPVKEPKRLRGLAALAKHINEWEDDTNSSSAVNVSKKQDAEVPKRTWKPPAPRPPISAIGKSSSPRIKPQAPQPPTPKIETAPTLNFDENLLNTLESQGFTRTTSNTRLVYNYESPKLIQHECIQEEPEPSPVHSPSKSIASRAAIFENLSPSRNTVMKDPALLSVAERKALFEKNKGAALLPKAPITMATPTDNKGSPARKSPVKSSSPVKSDKNIINVQVIKSPPKYPAPRPPIRPLQESTYRMSPGKPGGIASKVAALFQSKSTISQQQIESDVREQRQREMDVLLNRFHKSKSNNQGITDEESDDDDATDMTAMISRKLVPVVKKVDVSPSIPPNPPPLPCTSSKVKRLSQGKRCSTGDSPQVTAALEDIKRIKVSPSKPGRLYPCLSDIDAATETETDVNTASPTPNSSYEDNNYSVSESDIADTSFGRQVLETVCKNQTPIKQPFFDDSTESDMSDILDEKDDYLDEAVTFNKADNNGPSPPKQGRSKSPVEPSSSFQYKNCSPLKRKIPVANNTTELNELPTHVVDGDNIMPLTHTVSFYRKQQNEGKNSPVRKIIRSVIIEETANTKPISNEEAKVQQKIKELLEEIKKQHTIISQTSQALNLCYSTPEFTGSTEQVEAERVLLLASHRRSAIQREVERLQVLKTLITDDSNGGPLEKGTLIITNIVVPLKRDYVRALNATGGKGHHVVCLVKCAEQVLCTKLVSTVATNDRNPDLELQIPGTLRLENIYSNFTVQFEVYCLQAQEEVLPHEVKYHINNKKSSKLTPKKGKNESRLTRPIKESPAGPQAVRSPTFALMGYMIFSSQGINRKNWSLNNTPSMSPLEGIVEMSIKCEIAMSIEHRGFLTMLEDVSGYGNWHRRWCLLKGHTLSYWKYPEDERKKAPIGNIDLKHCTTQQIGPVRRDICARLHTILIETSRKPLPDDKNSLFMECMDDSTILRHLLSSDTKEERTQWCTMFNKVLMGIRMCSTKK